MNDVIPTVETRFNGRTLIDQDTRNTMAIASLYRSPSRVSFCLLIGSGHAVRFRRDPHRPRFGSLKPGSANDPIGQYWEGTTRTHAADAWKTRLTFSRSNRVEYP